MLKYIPHAIGGLGTITVLHLFFREFIVDMIQKTADGTVSRAKKIWKTLTKKRKFGRKKR